jgi:hypothetical protein
MILQEFIYFGFYLFFYIKIERQLSLSLLLFQPKKQLHNMLAKTISFYWVQKSHFYLKITWVKVRNKSNTTKFCNHPF